MELITVQAKDIQLHDILGEGQEVWAKVTNKPPVGQVTVYFGDHTLGNADFSKFQVFNSHDELINVIRR